MADLSERKCVACEGGVPALDAQQAGQLLGMVPGWELASGAAEIQRVFEFKNFYQTMEFANAVAFIANQENHHPDLELGYKRCKVRYSTHAAKGLTENDFICAAKINKLLEQ